MDLTDFLLARIAEDEATARAVVANLLVDEQDGISREWFIRYDSMNLWRSDVEYIARWDPSRVLTECDAKRRIVERCADRIDVTEMGDAERRFIPGAPDIDMLRLLAQPYAKHPDYREEWRP